MREQEIYILPIVYGVHEVRCIFNRNTSCYEVFIETQFAKVNLCSIKAARLHSKTEVYNLVKNMAENGEFSLQEALVKLLDGVAKYRDGEGTESDLNAVFEKYKEVI